MTEVGWTLIAGFVAFMLGAGGWRIEYEQPLEQSLPLMHTDRRRLRWIHWWMIPAVVMTVAGLGGLAAITDEPWMWTAVFAYAAGAVLWLIALAFRLSVGEWAAEVTAATGSVPDVYPPMARWAGLGHSVHMMTAYLSAIPVAWATTDAGLIPGWLGIAGVVWGLGLAAMFLIPKTQFIAAPPFWAHTFTFAIGIALL